jgi:Icc-related predicted phosphoesterase
MKILAVADHKDPLVYSPNIKNRFKDIDLVLGAGDLPMEYYGFIVSSLNRPLYFVFGNHNLKRYQLFKKEASSLSPGTSTIIEDMYNKSFGATYLNGNTVRIKSKNLLIAGLGGSMKYNKGANQYTEFGMFLRILKMIPALMWNKVFYGRYLDILLTHASPRGIHDREDPCHRGFRSFLWFMDKFQPRYLLHGHIHLYSLNEKRVTRYKETTVINVYDHYVIELEDNNG